MFAATGTKGDRAHGKDSMANIQDTGVFCVNIVATRQMDEMNASSRTDPKDTSDQLRRRTLRRNVNNITMNEEIHS